MRNMFGGATTTSRSIAEVAWALYAERRISKAELAKVVFACAAFGVDRGIDPNFRLVPTNRKHYVQILTDHIAHLAGRSKVADDLLVAAAFVRSRV